MIVKLNKPQTNKAFVFADIQIGEIFRYCKDYYIKLCNSTTKTDAFCLTLAEPCYFRSSYDGSDDFERFISGEELIVVNSGEYE